MVICMQQSPHYSRAPLTEALLDIRATLPSDVNLNLLAGVQTGDEDAYPRREDLLFAEGAFTLGEQVSAAARQRAIGYRFWSADGKQFFQAQLDGFTFNRQVPYENWESFQREARRLWQKYRDIARPTAITRVALRYINRLDLPNDVQDFDVYLTALPGLPPQLDRGMSEFLMRVVLPQDDMDSVLILTSALPSILPLPEAVSVILDIDLFRQDWSPSNDDDLWDFFERLRVRKNEIFNGCITHALREMIV